MKSLFSEYALGCLLAAGPLAGASFYAFKKPAMPASTTAKVKRVKPVVASATQNLDRYRKEVVHQSLAQHQSEFELCYNQFLNSSPQGSETESQNEREPSGAQDPHDPKAQGSITLNWLIDSEGRPNEVRVAETNMGNPTLEACVVGAVQKLEMAPPPNQVPLMIAHRFKFRNRTPEKLEF